MLQDLTTWGPRSACRDEATAGLQDVNSDQQNGGLDELLNYDRVTAAKLGQTAQSLDSALYSAFGQSEVSIIYTQLNQYYVVLEVAPQYWQSPEGLKNIYLHTSAATARFRCNPPCRQGDNGQHHAARSEPHGLVSLRSPFRSIWPRASR